MSGYEGHDAAARTFPVAEEDYLYGVGPIIVCVVSVLARVEYRGEPWWQVRARVANGVPENHGGWVEREVYLRATVVEVR